MYLQAVLKRSLELLRMESDRAGGFCASKDEGYLLAMLQTSITSPYRMSATGRTLTFVNFKHKAPHCGALLY